MSHFGKFTEAKEELVGAYSLNQSARSTGNAYNWHNGA